MPLMIEGLLLSLGVTVTLAAEFEARPEPYRTVARPAEGEVLQITPPCFVYPALGEHAGYRIEVAPGGRFDGPGVQRLGSPYLLATLDQPLAAGEYAWRWRPEGVADWSTVRTFVIAPEAVAVPFPDVDSLVRRLGDARPRLDLSAADLTTVRAAAAVRYGPRYADEVRRQAERLRDKELLPEPDPLPPNTDPRRIELYQKAFQTYRPFFGELTALSEGYLLTGDALAGEQARRRLLAICRWDPRGSTCLAQNDELATDVIRHCPVAYDRIRPLLSEAERRLVLDCLTIRMTEMRSRWRSRPFELNPYESHNMGYYLPDMIGACLALVGEAPVEEMLRYVLLQLWSPFYPPYGGDDGGWCEGPSYWGWSTAVFARTYQRVAKATGVPVHLRSNLRNMWRYGLYGSPPYFKMAPFGDGQESPANNGQTMARLAALYDNPHAAWYADLEGFRASGLEGLLTDLDRLAPRPPDDLPQSHAFFDVGLAAMHTVLSDPGGNVSLLLRSSPFGSISHAYADQNTFTLDAYGEPLIIASGYYQLYGHPHHANWTRQTKASNSVLVDGQGQPARDWNAKGKLATFRSTVAGDYAVADASAAYGGKLDRYVRHALFLKPIHTRGEPLIILRDALAAPQPATYQFLLHALNEMTIDPAGQRVTIARGNARCQVNYLAPAGLAFDQHDRFSDPPFRPSPNQWHLISSTVEPAPEASSLMVLQPHRAETQPGQVRAETGQGGFAVILEDGERSVTVLLCTAPAEESMVVGPWRTDARAASITTIGGRVVSTVLFEGRRVERDGQPLLTSEQPAASRSTYGTGTLISTDGAPPRVDSGASSAPPVATLTVAGRPAQPVIIQDFLHVQRRTARALVDVPTGTYRIRAEVAEVGGGRLPVTVQSGAAQQRRSLAPGETANLELIAELGPERSLTVSGEQAFGGTLELRSLQAERVYGVNLLPNGSFESVSDGVPVGWSRATISNGAWADLAAVEDGPDGRRALKLTCTAAGGDFGAMLTWPGLTPNETDRRFRISLRVKTGPGAVAGLQVTSADWSFWKNTERLSTGGQWQLAESEIVLPAGENLRNVRLHCRAAEVGAVLLVDDVRLVEALAD